MLIYKSFVTLFSLVSLLLFCSFSDAQNRDAKVIASNEIDSIQKRLVSSKAQNNKQETANLLFRLGVLSLDHSNTKALDYFNECSNLIEDTVSPLLQDVYHEQAKIYTTFSEFPEALRYALKSLEFNKINNIDKKILRDMSQIGYIYDRMYEFRESIKWNRDALKIAKEIKDAKGQALCYGRIGIAYDELAEKNNFNLQLFDSALYYNKKAAELSEANNDLAFARTTYSNIGNTYSKLKQYDKAEEFTLKSLSVPGYEDRKGVTLVNLGKIYLETGRYVEAKKILDSAMQNTIDYGTRKYQLEAFYRFHELDVKQGNYKSALSNYIEYKSIEDSLLNETKTKQIAEIGERYKTADKERQILVQRAALAEQNLTLQKRNYQLLAVFGLAIILGLIGYLLFNKQRIRNNQLQKENELKDALIRIETQNRLQEQRLRISRDLHDNIGAQLTFIISSIDNLKYKYDIEDPDLKDRLDDICNFTSGTILELRDTIWAMNSSKISIEDLKIRVLNFIKNANKSSGKINISLTVEDNVEEQSSMSSLNGINLYRIIQEAINNSIKYSNAEKIEVKVSQKNKILEIRITDNGIGFDLNEISYGNGLNNMKHRAEEIDADIIIDSDTANGTQIILNLDIDTLAYKNNLEQDL